MTDSADQISQVFGLSRDELFNIWKDVKLNSAKLQACKLHDFQPMGPAKILGQKYICRNCLGTVDSQAKAWYDDGLAHARSDV